MKTLSKEQNAELERDFRALIQEVVRQVYSPKYLIQKVDESGAYQAICEVLQTGRLPERFTTLYEAQRLNLSVEAFVLESKWREFFDEAMLIEAANRLREVGYIFD